MGYGHGTKKTLHEQNLTDCVAIMSSDQADWASMFIESEIYLGFLL